MKLYSVDLNNVSESELSQWFDAMSESRKEEVSRLKNDTKRKSKIAADSLSRAAVSEFCGISPAEIRFSKNEFGNPFAVGLDVFFSISHSGDLVCCAVSDREIGIDIEKKREIRLDAAKRFACESELEYIGGSTERFFEIWTLKEAYFKCIGTGLGADIKNVSFKKTDDGYECSENGFFLTNLVLPDGYTGFVCEKI